MKVDGISYSNRLSQMQFLPHKDADFHMIDAKVIVAPTIQTKVKYNPRIEPGSLEFWGMVIRAGFIHWQYERMELPVTHEYTLRKNRKPRGNKLGQPAQNSEVGAL